MTWNSTRWMTALFSFLMIGLISQQALAYSILYDGWGYPRTWHKNTVKYTLAANGSDDVTLNEIESSISAAFDSWAEISCTAIGFEFNGFKNFNPNQDIFIRWLETNWDMTVQDAMGVTTNWKMVGAGQGVKKVEIFFNGANFQWTTQGADDPFSNKVDVQAVATHEIGHAIGVAHSRERFATMFFTAFPGQTEAQRILNEDDKMAACFLYPAVPFTQGKVCDSCEQASNCTTGVCFSYGDEGAFCGKDCSASQPCPEGFGCYNIQGVSTPQCIPDNEHCAPVGGNIAVGDYCYDHSTCSSGRCLVLPDSAVCSQECNPSAGGNAGCPNDMKCIGEGFNGICYPKGEQELGDSCKSPADCVSFLCIGIGDGQGVCTQDCTSDSQCPGTMTCVVDKCLQLGSGQHGDPCTKMTECATGICATIVGYCSTLCETDADCPYEGQCLIAGVCNAGASGKVGDVCGPDAKTCQSGLKCTYQAQGDTTGICQTQCKVAYDDCPGNLYCQWTWQSWLNQVIGICVPNNGGLSAGSDCGGDAYCLPDLVCTDTDGMGAKCRQDCKTTNFLGCSNGATCIDLTLADDPQLGACHPKDGPPAAEQPQVVETHMDTASGTPDAGTNPGAETGPTTPPDTGTNNPPSNSGSSGGGCRTSSTGNGAWLWVLIALLAMRYRRRSMMITSS